LQEQVFEKLMVVGAAATCPLEVVKTRLQSSLYRIPTQTTITTNLLSGIGTHAKEVVNILFEIKRTEGLRALWKGLGPTLVGVVPARSIYFSVYTQGKHFYSKLNNNNESMVVHLLSAGSAGVCTSIVTNPIWLIKTRMVCEFLCSNCNLKQLVGRFQGWMFIEILFTASKQS
jgi:solute carrier family 25 protein 33/36